MNIGRRTRVIVGTTTNTFVYSGPHVVAEWSNNVLARSYSYGPDVDDVLSMSTYGAATNTYFYLKDAIGSVHALVNTNGTVVEQYKYTAWGEVTVLSSNGTALAASTYGNRFTWQGREVSYSTGLLFFRSRYYSASLGRWLSKDKIGISGGQNLYAFVDNCPTMFLDPFGLAPAETGFMGASQTMAGYLDGLLLGVLPNQDNANYRAGQTVGDVVGLAGGLARLGYAGAAKVTSLVLREAPTVGNAMKAVAIRNALKKAFRLNPWSEFRIYPFENRLAYYGGDLLRVIQGAGRTNKYLNWLGAVAAGRSLFDLFETDDLESSNNNCK